MSDQPMKPSEERSKTDHEIYHALLHHVSHDSRGEHPKNAVKRAEEKIIHGARWTEHEVHKVADWLIRDLAHAGAYREHGGGSLSDWLKFDVALIEQGLLQWLEQATDRSRIELGFWQQAGEDEPVYHSGETVTPGTFRCLSCGAETQWLHISSLPVCHRCHGNDFARETTKV